MKPNQAAVKRMTREYEARAAQWKREREAFVAEHGQAAWDAKCESEVNELYDAKEPYPMPGERGV